MSKPASEIKNDKDVISRLLDILEVICLHWVTPDQRIAECERRLNEYDDVFKRIGDNDGTH